MPRAYTAKPTATCYLDGKLWRGAKKFSFHQTFKENVSTGSVEGRNPPVAPRVGMSITWKWGYGGVEKAGFTGEVSDTDVASYPNTDKVICSDVLWRADKSSQVLQTDPLNEIAASAAVRYLLTHYGGISASRISIPTLPASGAAWVGGEWVLGVLTPVQWGDLDQQSGGTTALRAAAEICSCLGFWLYADASGRITAKQMERKPSTTAREVFQLDLNLLLKSPPHRQQNYENIYNQATVRGANTGVDGAQLYDQYRTTSPLLPAGVYRDFSFSSFLLEYENEANAGAAAITKVVQRILNVVSRIPDVLPPFAVKADPDRKVGDTAGAIVPNLRLAAQKNYFIYDLSRELDLNTGLFDDTISLDGGTGNSGFTTVPPPDASFSWELMREMLDGVDVVEVALDGSGSNSPSGEIVSWAWTTSTPTYAGTPSSASGEQAMLIFEAADSPADITLTVTDTTSKTGTFEASIDLTGADSRAPFQEALHAAAGSAWYATPDGGATWRTQAGDAISVDIIGAGADDRSVGTGGTYGIAATRGSGGAAGLQGSLDLLMSTPTSLVANSGAVTSNIWRNEAQPNRLWWAVGTAVYRSVDNGATKVAMATAPATVTWIMEDPTVENSIFLLSGADMLNATDPTVGYATLYEGPVGATARQFVRSRDGQVTWICYTGAPAGEALQRVETGAAADFDATDVRSLALNRQASSLRATIYAVTGDDPAQIWSFDGLTGLSAVQSTQTFPAGATVQHLLTSRQFDVIYAADFDSIASGQGAFRKYFAGPDQLLLWKALASGEQGHMLGLAARGTALAEFLRMTHAVDPGGVWHYRDGTWTLRPLPVGGTVRGIAIAADPFSPDRWLAVFNNVSSSCFSSGGKIVGDTWAYSPLWITEDAGVTWTEVIIAPPAGWVDGSALLQVSFNDQFANSWIAPFRSASSFYTAAVLGSSATVAATIENTVYSAGVVTSGADGEWLLATPLSTADADGIRYLDTSHVFHTPAGSAVSDILYGDRAPGASRVAYYPATDGTIYRTSDYRSAQPTSLLTGLGADAISVGRDLLYYLDGGNAWRVVDPDGAATRTQILVASATCPPRVDRQTRTIGAVPHAGAITVDDGVTTTDIPSPNEGFLASGATGSLLAFEVIVRA